MSHGLLVSFLILIAPLHWVLAFSLIHAVLNASELYWLYVIAWLVAAGWTTFQVLSLRAQKTWDARRTFHTYYTLPLGLLSILHLALFVVGRREFDVTLQALRPEVKKAPQADDVIQAVNAPTSNPGKMFRAFGALFLLILARMVKLIAALFLATPWWLWILIVAVAPFFRR